MRHILPSLIPLFVTLPLLAQSASVPAAAEPTQPQIDLLIKNLSDREYAARESADQQLRKIGWPAMTSLVRANTGATDEETKTRLLSLIQSICWDTSGLSPQAAKLVAQYKAAPVATGEVRDSMAQGALMRNDEASYLYFLDATLLSKAPVGPLRPDLNPMAVQRLQHIAALRGRLAWEQLEWEFISMGELPNLLLVLKDRPGDVGPLLDALQALKSSKSQLAPRLDPFIEELTCIAFPAPRKLEMLRKANGTRTLERVLAENEDWATLAQSQDPYVAGAALLFAGDSAAVDQTLAPALDSIRTDPYKTVPRQIVFLGRHGLIDQACQQGPNNDLSVFFLLLERRYQDAFRLHSSLASSRPYSGVKIFDGTTFASGPPELMNGQIDSRLVLALIKLNEIDRARNEIERLDKQNLELPLLNQASQLLGDDRALLLRLKGRIKQPEDTPLALARANFPQSPSTSMWSYFVWDRTRDPDRAWQMLLAIQNKSFPFEKLQELMPLDAIPPRTRPFDPPPCFQFLGAACYFASTGHNDLAARYLNRFVDASRPPSPGNWFDVIHLQLFAEYVLSIHSAQFAQQVFEALAKRPDADPSIQFLAGVFETENGSAIEGERLCSQSEVLMSGDIYRRLFLAQLLFNSGKLDLAAAQATLICQLDFPTSESRSKAQVILGRVAQGRGQFAQALQYYRLAYFSNLYDMRSIPEPYAQLFSIPRDAAYCESRDALSKNDTPSRLVALRAAQDVIFLDPEGLDLIIPLINAFKQAHLEDQAQSLTTLSRSLLENILKDFPNSHFHHYLIVKLDEETGFTTDQTQSHLQKAKTLSPNNPTYEQLR